MLSRTKSEKAPKSGRFSKANSGHLRMYIDAERHQVASWIKCTLGFALSLSSLSVSIYLIIR